MYKKGICLTTIAAISSAIGRSAIGIVRMSGPRSLEILESVFREKIEFEDRKMTYGHIVDGDTLIDEVLAVYMQGPSTYTREDMVEIYTHGGTRSVKSSLELLLSRGAELAEPGEFTKRAFLNGRLDLSQAEALMDIIDADTSLAHSSSLSQLEGSISSAVGPIKDKLKNVLASSITEIDFPEDENDTLDDKDKVDILKSAKEALDELITDSKRGKIIKEGIKTVILGRPNVGKSSLLNALLKDDRAIVTDVAGTTRDVIEEQMDLDGIGLRLLDTAGIRETDDLVEKIGVDMAKSHIGDADLILLVLDGSTSLSQEDMDLLELTQDRPRLVVINKADLGLAIDETSLSPSVQVSSKEKTGIKDLADAIKDMFFEEEIDFSNKTYVSNTRQIGLLTKARDSVESAICDIQDGIPLDLVELDINSAIDDLSAITGDASGEDILDQIFEEFCIGK